MDWNHWKMAGGIDVGQSERGLNFSDPGLLLDAACDGLGIALVSQLLAQKARTEGRLHPLTEQSVRGADWAWLIHRDSESNLFTQQFCAWLLNSLPQAN